MMEEEESVSESGGLLTQEPEEEEEEENNEEEKEGMSQQANDDGDDDESSDSSSSSSSSSISSDEEEDQREVRKLTYNEEREIRIKRNQAFLEGLGLGSSSKGLIAGTKNKKKQSEEDDDNDDDDEEEDLQQHRQSPRGMLLSTNIGFNRRRRRQVPSSSSVAPTVSSEPPQQTTVEEDVVGDDNGDALLDALYDKYPHRESQVRQLLGLLAPVDRNNINKGGGYNVAAVPAPILISGPSSTGKTAIIRDILDVLLQQQQLQQQEEGRSSKNSTSNLSRPSSSNSSVLATAYVNCTTLDVQSSVEGLTNSAFRQFEAQILGDEDEDENNGNGGILQAEVRKKRKREKRKRKREEKEKISSAEGQGTAVAAADAGASSTYCNEESHPNDNAEEEDTNNKNKRKKSRTHLLRSAVVAASDDKRNKKRTERMSKSQSSVLASLSAVYRFGRSIRGLFHQNRRCDYSGILVVDHAELMLSFLSASRNNNISKAEAAQCNLLGQLLLVPRTLGINLTVVVITNSFLLEHSRLNTPISSVYLAAQPICIRFPAYRGKSVIKEVLKQQHVVNLITGEEDDSTAQLSNGQSSSLFRHRVIDAFLDTLVQSLQSTTLDIRDMVRIGRKLYSKYTQPINSQSSLDKTVETARKAPPSSTGTGDDDAPLIKEIISFLDRKILPALRHELERGLWSLGCSSHKGTARHDLPVLSKYLLLAAFLCQVNRPDKDKHLFSIQKNGRRRKRDAGRDDVEDVAFGPASIQEQPKIFRPKTFPMERMLSVYVSLVGLNSDGEERLRSLGGAAFFESIGQLRDIGLLHEHPKRSLSETIRLSEPRYWSPLTIEDAKAIASSLNFPLDRYIL